jgi:hypothetical protein
VFEVRGRMILHVRLEHQERGEERQKEERKEEKRWKRKKPT